MSIFELLYEVKSNPVLIFEKTKSGKTKLATPNPTGFFLKFARFLYCLDLVFFLLKPMLNYQELNANESGELQNQLR